MSLQTVTLTGRYLDASNWPLPGQLVFTPNVPLVDATDSQVVPDAGVTVTLNSAGAFSVPLYATDSGNLVPPGWAWNVTVAVGGLDPVSWSFFLPFSDGAVQDISDLTPVVSAPPMGGYLTTAGGTLAGTLGLDGTPPIKLASGTSGYVLTSDSSGDLTLQAPGGGTGTVTSVTAGDSSIVVGGSSAAPTIETGTLDVIAADHPPAANWSNNSRKITSLTPGAATGEAVAFQQLPSNSSPLAITSGGTGSGSQNFVDLTTAQSIGGEKTFTGEVTVPAPVNTTDAATKAYVDATAQGLSVKNSVNESTAAALASYTYSNGSSGVGATLTGTSTGVLTVDGQAVALDDRVLVQNETGGNAPYNGIYLATTAGASGVAYVLTRSTDMDAPAQFPGAFTFVENGSVNKGAGFVCTTPATVTVGTTGITWTQFSAAGDLAAGTGLSISGGTISLITPVSAANGGTGNGSGNAPTATTAGGLQTTTAPVVVSGATAPASGQVLTATSSTAAGWATLPSGFANPMTTTGDLIDGGSGGTPGRLAGNTSATKNFLTSTGTGSAATAPAWGTIAAGDVPALNQSTTGTAAGLSSTLAIGSGGTGQTSAAAAYNALSPMTTTGDLEYESGTGTAARLAGNTTSVKKFLTQTGTGTVSAAPGWNTIAAGDVPVLNQNTTGTAAGLSATLAPGSGGTGQTSAQAAMDALAGATTSGGYLRGNGTHVVMNTIQAADVPTLNQSTTGNAATATAAAGLKTATTTVTLSTATAPAAGQVLTATSSVAADWQTPALAPAARTGTATVAAGEFSACTTTSAAYTLTLSTPAASGAQYAAKLVTQGTDVDGNGYAVTLAASGSDVFNKSGGATSLTLSVLNQGVSLQYLAGSPGVWYVTDDDLPLGQLDARYGAVTSSVTWSSGTQTVSVASAQVQQVTLGANVTSVTFANASFAAAIAQNLTLYISQPATGTATYTVAGWTGVTWYGGSAPAIATGNSALTVLTFQSLDGGQTWHGGIVSNAALPLPAADGGTGLTSLTTNQLLAGNASSPTGPVQQIGYGTTGYVLTSGGSSAAPSWAALSALADPDWTAADSGLVAWNYDPCITNGGSQVLATAGLLYVMAVKVVAAATVTYIYLDLTANGSGLTHGFAALFQGGSLLGQTSDQVTPWGSGSTNSAPGMAISGGPVSVAAGIAYVGVWFTGTTGPTFYKAAAQNFVNVGLAAGNSRWGTANTGLTTTAPGTLGTITASEYAYWCGLG